MRIITMMHVFVFPSVTDVIITRHRQNIYLPWIGGVEEEGVAAVEVMVALLTDGGVTVAGGAGRGGMEGDGVAVAVAGGWADSVTGG